MRFLLPSPNRTGRRKSRLTSTGIFFSPLASKDWRKLWNRLIVFEMELEPEKRYCLPELPVAQVQDNPQVFQLVVETTHYRIEIEIG